MKRIALAALAAAVVLLGIVLPAETPEASGSDQRVTRSVPRVVPGVLVVGDSITYNSRHQLRQRRPAWQIHAKRGRPVTALPGIVDDLIASGRVPRNLVLALGSNARRSWRRADFEAVVDSLPKRVSITFMTTYRDPAYWGGHPNWGKRPRPQRIYSRWMRRVAADRPNVCLMHWRRLVKHRPHLLRDGVHPNWRGKHRWAELLIRSANDCRARS